MRLSLFMIELCTIYDGVIYYVVMKNGKYRSNLTGAFATYVSTAIETSLSELGGRSLNHEAALVAIYNHPKETIDTLSKVLFLTHSGTVRLVNTLEAQGLVTRIKSTEDARAIVLQATPEGNERVEKILSSREKAIGKVFDHFDSKQRQEFTDLLRIAMQGLTKEKLEARRICRLCNEGVCRKAGCPVEQNI
jgi:DNA-binding MarR family transcriptional regulator